MAVRHPDPGSRPLQSASTNIYRRSNAQRAGTLPPRHPTAGPLDFGGPEPVIAGHAMRIVRLALPAVGPGGISNRNRKI
jgi:hypothetical protein